MTTLMFFHVLTGTLAVLAGFTALFTKKGQITHRAAGNLFFATMLIMSLSGSIIAFQITQTITFIAGLFTCYLVATAWRTVKTAPNTRSFLDVLGFVFVLGVAGFSIYSGMQAMNSPEGTLDGFGAGPYYFFGVLALLAACLDIVYLYKHGHHGKHRIARHVWRMCFALYIAAGSLFTGPGATIFPESVQQHWGLSIPELVVALAMFSYLGIVLFTQKISKIPA